MADEEVKIEDKEEITPEVEVDVVADVEEVPTADAELSALDNLGNVVDAHITKDDDAAIAAFHDYLTQKVKSTLNPEVEDDVGDEAEVNADEDDDIVAAATAEVEGTKDSED